MVEQAMLNVIWMTGLNRISSEDHTSLWIKLQEINFYNGDDQICWNPTASANYSSTCAYKAQLFGSFSPIDYNKLWKSKVQPKCKFFMCLLLRKRILTDDVLHTRGMNHGEQCTLCDQEQETATHLVFDCPYA
jgi:hypothetical protein